MSSAFRHSPEFQLKSGHTPEAAARFSIVQLAFALESTLPSHQLCRRRYAADIAVQR